MASHDILNFVTVGADIGKQVSANHGHAPIVASGQGWAATRGGDEQGAVEQVLQLRERQAHLRRFLPRMQRTPLRFRKTVVSLGLGTFGMDRQCLCASMIWSLTSSIDNVTKELQQWARPPPNTLGAQLADDWNYRRSG